MKNNSHNNNNKDPPCISHRFYLHIDSIYTFAPIWFPHCPAWMWTISLMVRCGCGQRASCLDFSRCPVFSPQSLAAVFLKISACLISRSSFGAGEIDKRAAGRMTSRTAQHPCNPSANRSAPVWCSGLEDHAASSPLAVPWHHPPCPMQEKCSLYLLFYICISLDWLSLFCEAQVDGGFFTVKSWNGCFTSRWEWSGVQL